MSMKRKMPCGYIFPNIGKGSPKLQRHWTGPYIITKRINDAIYQVRKSRQQRPKMVHHNRLKPYNGNNKPSWYKNL